MLTIACVYRSMRGARGNPVGSRFCMSGDYGPEQVMALGRAIVRHSDKLAMHCLTDVDNANWPFYSLRLQHDWAGWWSKIELFREFRAGTTLYLDLDNIIIGDISDLVAIRPAEGEFYGMHDWHIPDIFNSSVMMWSGDWSWLYERFAADPAGWAAKYAELPKVGDQAFIQDALAERGITPKVLRDHLPEGFFCPSRRLFQPGPDDERARMVAWVGKPKLWKWPMLKRAMQAI
jgi:hypothetical protein